jgi:hypothetical protein
MEVGFFFWPYDLDLVRRMSNAAERYSFDLIGIADTPATRWTRGWRQQWWPRRPSGHGSRSALATWSRAIRRFPPQQSPHLTFWLQTAQSSALVLGVRRRFGERLSLARRVEIVGKRDVLAA